MYLLLLFVCIGTSLGYYSGFPHVIKKTASYWERYAKKQGPNMCVREILPNKDVSYDRAWTGGKYCGAGTMVKFECCDGYETVRGAVGCPLVKSILPASDVADISNAGSFMRLQDTAKLWNYLSTYKKNAVTLLSPLDKSLNKMSYTTWSNLNYSVSVTYRFQEAPSLFSYHVLQGTINLRNLPPDSTSISLYNDQHVRFNVFSNGLVTANCVPIVKGDLISNQGTIHILEHPLNPSYMYSLTDTILRNVNLRRLANYISQGRFESLLRSDGPFTLFAPTDEAFTRLAHQHVHDILYDDEALKALVNHHIVNGVLCSALLQNATIRNRNAATLRSKCTSAGTIIGGAKIQSTDEMSTNGVIHTIDRVILPRRAKYLLDILQDLGLTTLTTLIKNSGLESIFNGGNTITFFAPTNLAFQSLNKVTMSNILYQSIEAQSFLTNHMAVGKQFVKNLLDNQLLQSKGNRQHFRIRQFRNNVMVDNGVITNPDVEGLNGVIHVIDTVLTPVKQSIIQFLTSQGNYTRFITALTRTSPSLINLLDSTESPFTVFAVPDYYIDRWATDLFTYHRMISDLRIVNEILRNHVLPGTLFSSSQQDNSYTKVTSKSVQPLLVRKISPAQIYVGDSLVIEKDIVCTNGVIHVVNRLIQVPNPAI